MTPEDWAGEWVTQRQAERPKTSGQWRGGGVVGSRVTGIDEAAAYAYGTVQAAPLSLSFYFPLQSSGS